MTGKYQTNKNQQTEKLERLHKETKISNGGKHNITCLVDNKVSYHTVRSKFLKIPMVEFFDKELIILIF